MHISILVLDPEGLDLAEIWWKNNSTANAFDESLAESLDSRFLFNKGWTTTDYFNVSYLISYRKFIIGQ